MIQITDPSDCCGCTACISICGHDAITMEPDALGFLYPKVNFDKCVDCKLCEKVCAFNDHYDTSLNLPTPDVYGARHKNPKQVAPVVAVLRSLQSLLGYLIMEVSFMVLVMPNISELCINVILPKKNEMSSKEVNTYKAIWTIFSDK